MEHGILLTQNTLYFTFTFVSTKEYFLWRTLYFLPCGFFFLPFSSSNLSHRTFDVYHTTHGVALVQI